MATLAHWTLEQILQQLDSGHTWSGASITYAFPTSALGMFSEDGEAAHFLAADALTKTQVRLALQTWDDLIPANFVEVTSNLKSTGANIEIGMAAANTKSFFAQTYFPDAGSVWLNASYSSGVNDLVGAAVGTYGFATYIHELGHALGLEHMGNYNGTAGGPSSYQDSTVYSLMSYYGPSGPFHDSRVADADWTTATGEHDPQTPMLDDVMAIQSMYGASTTTRVGDTTYGYHSNVTGNLKPIYDFSLNAAPVLCIFDSSGNDTLDLSGWSDASTISLVPGTFSSGAGMTNNISIAYGCTIENAVGGSGSDTLIGNAGANRLEGGAGNDTLSGGDGNDTLAAGLGNDAIDGGDGADTCVIGASFASCKISYDSSTLAWRISSAAIGVDLVSNVETFQFLDGVRTPQQLLGSGAAPVLIAMTPADDAGSVAVDAGLVLEFNDAVKAGSGQIVLYNGNGSVARTLSVGDAMHVSIDGARVFVDPGDDLDFNSYYSVGVTSGALIDVDGNAFAGIAGGSAWNFTTEPLSLVEGTDASDDLAGSDGKDRISGFASNDRLIGSGGNDSLEGGSGIDTAVFSGPSARYTVQAGATTTTVTDTSGADGTDTLVSVERLRFSDGGLALDIDGHAGTVARVLGAVFGADGVTNPGYVSIGLEFADAGWEGPALVQLALDERLGSGASPAEVVQLLYRNVTGTEAGSADLANYVDLLASGAETPASLGWMAASTGLTADLVGLDGLFATGIRFL